MDISIVIPAFNEERRIQETLTKLDRGALEHSSHRFEVLISNDGSTDGTVEVARSFTGSLRPTILSDLEHRGKGAALAAGADLATYGTVVFLDADMPVEMATIVEMARLTESYDLVLGCRRGRGAVIEPPRPWFRSLGAVAFRFSVRLMGLGIASDPQCGVKALCKDAVNPVLDEMTIDRFGFDIELISRARLARLEILEVPVAWRHVPGSTVNPMRDAMTTLADLWGIRSDIRRRSTAEP